MDNYVNQYKTAFDQDISIPHYALSIPTSPQTANQLAEATKALNAGVSGIDLAPINPELFEQIPSQHFDEVRRLAKLAGAKPTIHGPIVDLAGFSQQGWSEMQRKQTEKQVEYFVDQAHKLDPEGNTPINFHVSTQAPGVKWVKLSEEEFKALPDEEQERLRDISTYEFEREDFVGVVNRDTGQLSGLPYEIKEYIGGTEVHHPQKILDMQNQSQWDQKKLEIFELQRKKSEVETNRMQIISQVAPIKHRELTLGKDSLTQQERSQVDQADQNVNLLDQHIHEFDIHINTSLNSIHNQFKKYMPEKMTKEQKDVVRQVEKNLENIGKEEIQFREQFKKMARNAKPEEEPMLRQMVEQNQDRILKGYQTVLGEIGNGKGMGAPAPEVFARVDDVAMQEIPKTISNVAFNSYQKYGEHTPLIVIENYQPELNLGRSDQLREVIVKSRNEFAGKLINQGMSKDKADKTAEKLIGVTWDVGHINFMRKHGYSEKEVLEETKKIAKYVKQVHITDNFGFNDAHLPPGMGNAPIKEELKILEDAGFKFDKGNVINEAGAFAAQMKESPHPYVASYFNSPLYPLQADAPNWQQMWEQEAMYSIGYGDVLPQIHFKELYGSGFSSLPTELGGQTGQDRSRFTGTPME